MSGHTPAPKRTKDDGEDRTPFDVWLDRGLHRLFDEVAQEPVPEELMKLIEADRPK